MKSVIKSLLKAGLFPALAIAAMVAAPCTWAQGTSFTYQGQLDDGGYVADGSYDMEFKVWDASSGGAQVGGTATFFAMPVDGGLFSVDLDFGSGIFTGPDRWLEISVQTNGGGGFITLSPRTEFTSTPYAIAALSAQSATSVPDGSIGSSEIAANAVTAEKIATSQVVKSLNGMTDQIALTAGSSIALSPSGNQIQIDVGNNGWIWLEGTGANGSEGGIKFGSYPNGNTFISEWEDDGIYLVAPEGIGMGPGNVGIHVDSLSAATHALTVATGTVGDENILRLIGPGGTFGVGAKLNFGDGDFVYLQENTDDSLLIYSSGTQISGGNVAINESLSVGENVAINESLSVGGNVAIGGATAQKKLDVDLGDIIVQGPDSCDAVGEAGTVYLGTVHHYIKGEYGAGVKIGTYGIGDVIHIQEVTGNVGIGTNAPQAKLDVIGRIRTTELEITGGADLSEQFDIDGLSHRVEPGMIVCIDASNPGKLAVSSKAYDRTVAGVVSGAGGVKPGMLMGQSGTVADGEHPVALSGRVYCRVDASQGAIEPGDLITTSNIPGYGMKVADRTRAHGAIIGKAMTGLDAGQGLVLVLVSLH